jgi:hypothetical protein
VFPRDGIAGASALESSRRHFITREDPL